VWLCLLFSLILVKESKRKGGGTFQGGEEKKKKGSRVACVTIPYVLEASRKEGGREKGIGVGRKGKKRRKGR